MCSLSIISYVILICKEKIYITVNFSTKNCISEDMQSRNFVYFIRSRLLKEDIDSETKDRISSDEGNDMYFISSSGHALHGHVPQNALHYSSGQ